MFALQASADTFGCELTAPLVMHLNVLLCMTMITMIDIAALYRVCRFMVSVSSA